MDLQREIEKKIEKKRQDIASLETQLSQAKAVLNSLIDIIKLFQHSPDATANRNGEETVLTLRHGSDVGKAKEFLEKAGRPHHIREILKGISKESTRKSRASLGSQLNVYARKGIIFRKHRPNVFGLIGQEGPTSTAPASLPDSFGKL